MCAIIVSDGVSNFFKLRRRELPNN